MRINHLVLHACCTPCTIKSYEWLASGQAMTRSGETLSCERVTILYYNPNIAPADEYARRRDALMAYCADHDIKAVELEYRPELWDAATAAAPQPPERCRACYRLRLDAAAAWATQAGADALTTTLTISPYQLADVIAEEGQRAVAASAPDGSLRYLDIDFSPWYRESQNAARSAGIYVQNYCGCLPSKREAEAQRAARRAGRKAAKQQRQAATATAATGTVAADLPETDAACAPASGGSL